MIEILPMGEIPTKLLFDLVSGLKEIYGVFNEDFRIRQNIQIPIEVFDHRRGQYRSDLILDRIEKNVAIKDKVLGVTNVDLFVPQLNFVFGQAQLSGKIAIVSTRRLDPTFYRSAPNHELLIERTIKESVHELGHVFGLRHCPNSTCVMSFSNSILEVDRKTKNFCDRCMKILKTLT
ncbi:MAG: hypothetical protein APU95_02060 [Hadesarchaea archaeon YNP_N21]|jgi:archaemetzincin|nr:MAG: hypothetical protein APU95_02060 [Hadesarchaea archaeon YNP_N21]